MYKSNKEILNKQLDKVYDLINKLDIPKQKGTTLYNVIYELEQINIMLDIPFRD